MEELQRLRKGGTDKPQGVGTVQLLVHCDNNADSVLKKCKEVLAIVLENSTKKVWPCLEEWQQLLPKWFVSKCAKETSSQEDEKWLVWWKSLSLDQQILVEDEKDWSLSEWIGWFEPGERQWFWWNSTIINQNEILIEIGIIGWPFVWGSLKWLLKFSGATSISILE